MGRGPCQRAPDVRAGGLVAIHRLARGWCWRERYSRSRVCAEPGRRGHRSWPGRIVGDQPEFSIRSDGCSGRTLPPGGACALHVAFAPATTRGPRTGRLELRLGGAVDSVQLDGLVSVGTTSLVMHSQPGDYVGQGLDYDFTPANAASTFGGGPYGINAWVTSGRSEARRVGKEYV